MTQRNSELGWAFLAVLLISLLYLGVVYRLGSIPAAQSFFGHSLGITGFLLMLMTEILYSIRKRSRSARWGRMAAWLRFHIFTGLVGPYLVLLHSAWKFNGLAGVVLLLTVVIVVSGFIGRYIYTAVPRTADGLELQGREINTQLRLVEEQIEQWVAAQPTASQPQARRLAAMAFPGSRPLQENTSSSTSATVPAGRLLPSPGLLQWTGARAVLGRVIADLAFRLEWLREQRRLDSSLRSQTRQLRSLVQQRQSLKRQVESIAAARRLLATWHAVHIPIGMALFTAAFVHVAAAIYYATLLH